MNYLKVLFVIAVIALANIDNNAAENTVPDEPDYLKIVRDYADALLKNGRDTIGTEKSPLISTTLRRTAKGKDGYFFVSNGSYREWRKKTLPDSFGIRVSDRMYDGANPQHDQNLYQILYALSEITGEKKYAEQADEILTWFFNHCQSKTTNLLAWGEHLGWYFDTETFIPTFYNGKNRKKNNHQKNHEFFRPWVLWEKSFQLAPEVCAKFATGLWEHQIHDQKTGNFSRHAWYQEHHTTGDSEYPRHGGFYIDTWAHAYHATKNPEYLKAIETLLNYYENRRSPQSGAIPSESHKRSNGNEYNWVSNLSFAISLHNASFFVPEELGEKMRKAALKCDEVLLKLPHDLSHGGKGFVKIANTHTLEPGMFHTNSKTTAQLRRIANDPAYQNIYTTIVACGYGGATHSHARDACNLLLRYRQVPNEKIKKLILQTADIYLNDYKFNKDSEIAVYPGFYGKLIYLQLGAYELSKDKKYLECADHFAKEALSIFFDDKAELPLPKASHRHDHYEAVTMGDTLMMELLELWVAKNKPDAKASLIYNER